MLAVFGNRHYHAQSSRLALATRRIGQGTLMDQTKPTIEFVEPTDGQKRWKIELRNFKQLEEAFGRDVLNAFSRCFVHADRLTSTVSCIYASEKLHSRDSVAFERDLNSMVWFTIGTLRELATAIQDLRAALRKRGRLDPNSPPWVTLRGLEDRWEGNEFYRKKRDVGAFHVDPEVIDKGLDELIKDQKDVTLSLGDGRRGVESQLALGLLALHNGLDLDLEGYRQFLQVVSDDHGDAASAIQEAFIDAARAAGVLFGGK